VNQRLYGQYKDNLDGFIAQVKMVKKHCIGKGAPALTKFGYGADQFTREGQNVV